ncbi:MAG: hypothetical protein LBK82_10100 [Planctomycetaceae bacterium]|nr:hypothetical protein [Planctomycetaceae bacterium]
MGDPPAGRSRRLSLHFAIINLIHCRRVRRRDLSAKGRPPTKGCPPFVVLVLFVARIAPNSWGNFRCIGDFFSEK